MPAVAVTDTNNMFAALEFSVTATGRGRAADRRMPDHRLPTIRPRRARSARPPAPIVLLAQSEAGYMNLMKLNFCLYIGKGGQLPQVTLEELAAAFRRG